MNKVKKYDYIPNILGDGHAAEKIVKILEEECA